MSHKRDLILQSAEEEFLLHGFDGTSIDSIVREVGGSKSTVYSHFPDKTVLFAEAIAGIRKEFDFLLPYSRNETVADARDLLELAVVEFLSILFRERAMHLFRLMMAEAQRFPEVARQFWNEGPARSLDRLSEIAGGHAYGQALFNMLIGERYYRVLLGLDPIPDPEQIVGRAREAISAVLGSSGT